MIVLIDNYDSFTYNLYDYVLQQNVSCQVFRNDECTIEAIEILAPKGIIISPGPCTPSESGISNQVIHHFHQKLPILGVCLGHQAMGELFGAKLIQAAYPMHGKTSQIHLDNSLPIFNNIPETISVMRYHSLILENVPRDFKLIASTSAKEIMAIHHQELPLIGLQFHPESILTEYGIQMITNFVKEYLA